MESNNNLQENKEESKEIDILEMLKYLFSKRKFIIKFTAVFLFIGLFIAIFSPKQYTSTAVIVPQIGKLRTNGLSSLAALAGIDLGNANSSDVISPLVYDKILNNVNFQRDLINMPINFNGQDTTVKIIDYYTDKKYKRFSLLGTITKYTIGLPGVILASLKRNEVESFGENNDSIKVESLSKKEYICLKAFRANFNLDIDSKNGYITISTTMPEAKAAAQVAQSVIDLLQKYITEFKIQKAEDNYKYVQQRFNEISNEYIQKQEEYAKFLDANKGLSSAVSKAKEEFIRNETSALYSVYSQLKQHLLQSELKVKEDTPILTVVTPPIVPVLKSAPNRLLILFAFVFLGLAFSSGIVLGIDWLKKNNFSNKFIDKIDKKIS